MEEITAEEIFQEYSNEVLPSQDDGILETVEEGK